MTGIAPGGSSVVGHQYSVTPSNIVIWAGDRWVEDGGPVPVSGGGYITAVYTSNAATLTLPATNNLLEIIRQGTPAALTINLPASPTTNLFVSVKDGGNNFATNNATVKTTDGTQIDGVAGSTGFFMNQNRQASGFIFDGVMWNIE
jgi:hypothetical protein